MAEEPNREEEPVSAGGMVPPSETDASAAPDPNAEPEVQAVQFTQLSSSQAVTGNSPLELILDVQLGATVELGRSRMAVREILALGPGSLVELDKLAGEPADLLINGKPLARGEIVVIDENFGIRITEIMTRTERLDSLR
jgi:flagellar motor switch protein FliN/FliY